MVVVFSVMVVLLQFSSGKVCCRVTEARHSNHEQRDNGFTGKEDELIFLFHCLNVVQIEPHRNVIAIPFICVCPSCCSAWVCHSNNACCKYILVYTM